MKNLVAISYVLLTCFTAQAQYGLEKLPTPINSDLYDEICPVMSFDEKTLFFTRSGSPDFDHTLLENHKDLYKKLSADDYHKKLVQIYSLISGKYIDDPVSSDFNQDIWMSTLGESPTLHHPTMPVNNAFPNSICSNYSRDNEYVVINEFPIDGGLEAGFSYVKKMDNGRFTIPIPIVIYKFKEKGAAVNLSMSNDGQHIFISMNNPNRPEDQDIYVSIKVKENFYSEPKKLSSAINTPYREATPFISQDKNRLYFSSDRPGGEGKMDIYYSERQDYTYRNWSEPKKLGFPINSPYDDSHPYVLLDENTMVFSSSRDGTSDIFTAKMYRDDLLDKPIAVNLNIRNEAGALIQGALYWHEAYTGKGEGFFRTNTGQYRYIIEDNIPMTFYARRRGTYSEKPFVDPQVLKNEGIHEITLDLILPSKKFPPSEKYNNPSDISSNDRPEISDLLPLETNRTIVLKNIYFARSKPEVLEVSFPALKQLAKVLKERNHVQIQIEGHTDNVGNKKDLMDLSWARAEAIKAFLVAEGVLPENILTLGYGDTRPITSNATEVARKKNRRVEIRVIKQ